MYKRNFMYVYARCYSLTIKKAFIRTAEMAVYLAIIQQNPYILNINFSFTHPAIIPRTEAVVKFDPRPGSDMNQAGGRKRYTREDSCTNSCGTYLSGHGYLLLRFSKVLFPLGFDRGYLRGDLLVAFVIAEQHW